MEVVGFDNYLLVPALIFHSADQQATMNKQGELEAIKDQNGWSHLREVIGRQIETKVGYVPDSPSPCESPRFLIKPKSYIKKKTTNLV